MKLWFKKITFWIAYNTLTLTILLDHILYKNHELNIYKLSKLDIDFYK